MSRRAPHLLLAALACASIALAGCGGGGTPGYCSDRSQLEDSIKGLTSLTPSGGLSGLQSQLQQIQSDANALVASARSDFPDQTSAISSSVARLRADVAGLPSSPSPTQIATIATDAASVVSAVRAFTSATSDACS